VGAAACAGCHSAIDKRWHAGRHSKMAQPATAESVKGDFSQREITLRGDRYRLRAENGAYFISESVQAGREQEHRVDLTLGNRRIQHYLSRRDDGWIVVLPPTWDVERKVWFHNMEIVRPDEKQLRGLQVWNKNCDGCHVSGQSKNFDTASKRYATEWQDTGTSCERCHGPGAGHAAHHQGAIVDPAALPPARATAVCAQCHSLRDVVVGGFVAGADYYDHFMPLLEYGPRDESDPAWWPDGTPRRFSNDALGFWESRCYRQGQATCTSCHDPHEPDVDKNPRLQAGDPSQCTGCHAAIGHDLEAHTHHAPKGAGSACVDCHMPRTVISIKAKIRDHSLGVPAPLATARYGIPNACNECHPDQSPQWAEAALSRWYPENRRGRRVERAAAFTRARAGAPEAVAPLVTLAETSDESALVRANAVGYLARYKSETARAVVLRALRSDEPLLRAVSALNAGGMGLERGVVQAALAGALRDERRVVRDAAALSLVGLGVVRLAGEDGARLEQAKADYVARARFHSDDPPTQLELGKFLLLDQRFREAAEALELSRHLDPAQPVDYFLALSDVGLGRIAEARTRLGGIASADPNAPAARLLLERLKASGDGGRPPG
jgi:predicted CXXCH cytochrome family protein